MQTDSDARGIFADKTLVLACFYQNFALNLVRFTLKQRLCLPIISDIFSSSFSHDHKSSLAEVLARLLLPDHHSLKSTMIFHLVQTQSHGSRVSHRH